MFVVRRSGWKDFQSLSYSKILLSAMNGCSPGFMVQLQFPLERSFRGSLKVFEIEGMVLGWWEEILMLFAL